MAFKSKHKHNKAMDSEAKCLEMWQFLFLLEVNILDYLNFNSNNIRLGYATIFS